MSFTEEYLIAAHNHSSFNQKELSESAMCVCFYCLRTYPANEIEEWIDEPIKGKTAQCAYCGIDSVIGDKSGFPISDENFLKALHEWAF